MIVMHGLFGLKDDCDEVQFRDSFDAFSGHLKQLNLLITWRFMRQEPHDGYNRRPPEAPYYVSMEFLDNDQAEACWAYVEQDEEPLKSLHRAMNRQVQNTQFFLSSDV
ncbi:DUF6614 family protein [Pelagibius sp. Alg239-R121]|uniref:DUF6614 family protein n=1 Tax=Pelagibius sp. Alg239-R121 TaxID=2993448 RepID=UPI0024A72A9A|nr:DUF6614 family protein [Pelagibius sp. Alg239-R121]